MVYVNCPVCGHKLVEGQAGSEVRLKCSKCGEIVKVVIGEEGVTVSQKKERAKAAVRR